jgi:EAL and modified HD-GYP domain-containing signal transduction protein
VQLALFAGKDNRGLSSPLLEMAAVRGRLMEILMMQLTNRQRTSEQVETAFLTGILSLLDVLYETSMQSVVDSLNLSDEMAAALLYRRGFLGKLLELTERLEKMDFAAVHKLLEELSISFDQLQQAQLAAFSWRYSIVQNQLDAC